LVVVPDRNVLRKVLQNQTRRAMTSGKGPAALSQARNKFSKVFRRDLSASLTGLVILIDREGRYEYDNANGNAKRVLDRVVILVSARILVELRFIPFQR
jgi:hypothetical protein